MREHETHITGAKDACKKGTLLKNCRILYAKTIRSLTRQDITSDYFPIKIAVKEIRHSQLDQVPSVFVLVRIVLQNPNRGKQPHKSTGPSAGSIIHQTANSISLVLNVLHVTTVIGGHHRVLSAQRYT